MSYYFAKTPTGKNFDNVVSDVTAALKEQGFGIPTEIDVSATMKKNLDKEFRNYRILGACNPPLAHKALEIEDKIGTMLRCNVIVQATEDGRSMGISSTLHKRFWSTATPPARGRRLWLRNKSSFSSRLVRVGKSSDKH